MPAVDAIVELVGRTASDVFAELCIPLAERTAIPRAELVAALHEREALAPTAFGSGIAVPHGVHPALTRMLACFGRSRAGVDVDAPDGRPVHLFVALVRPPEAVDAHLAALASWSRVLADASLRAELIAAEPDALASLLSGTP